MHELLRHREGTEYGKLSVHAGSTAGVGCVMRQPIYTFQHYEGKQA